MAEPNNTVSNSPIQLTPDRAASRSIPEPTIAVQDAFGPKAVAMLHQGRWRGLVPRDGSHVFVWLDAEGRKLKPSGVTTSVSFAQTLESDAAGRALVLAGPGDGVYAVDPSGAARCLGLLADATTASTACWLAGGGVALAIGSTIAIYLPSPDGRLRPHVRFDVAHPEIWGMRCLVASDEQDPDTAVLAVMADDRGSVYAIPADGRVRVLANFDALELAEVRIYVDGSGLRTWLPDGLPDGLSGGLSGGPLVAGAGSLVRVEGIPEALAMLRELPEATLSFDAAPDLNAGPDIPALEPSATLEVPVELVPDALTPPSLDRLGPLTAALITRLRAGPQRDQPKLEMLKLIRAGMPDDLRAYVHAWACYSPSLNTTVYEYWLGPPKLEHLRELAGDAISLGSFASGEPIFGRLTGAGSCEVVMIDEEGVPYRYYGLEGFLADLRARTPNDWAFELDV